MLWLTLTFWYACILQVQQISAADALQASTKLYILLYAKSSPSMKEMAAPQLLSAHHTTESPIYKPSKGVFSFQSWIALNLI